MQRHFWRKYQATVYALTIHWSILIPSIAHRCRCLYSTGLFQCVNHERSPSLFSRSPMAWTTQTAHDIIQHPHSCQGPLGIHRILTAFAELVWTAKASQSSMTVPQPGHCANSRQRANVRPWQLRAVSRQPHAPSLLLCPVLHAELAATHRLLASQQGKALAMHQGEEGKAGSLRDA